MSDAIKKIKERHADAIAGFEKYYKEIGLFGKPTLEIGVQSFAFDYSESDPRHDKDHREWFGIMVAAALKTLVDEHTGPLRAENERLRETNSELSMTAQWARNRLEEIADGSWWHGDARDFKRSLVGVFADFDEALQRATLNEGEENE